MKSPLLITADEELDLHEARHPGSVARCLDCGFRGYGRSCTYHLQLGHRLRPERELAPEQQKGRCRVTMVRFATTCDICAVDKRSEEYTAFPTCRECDAHVCPECAAPDSLVTGDGERQDLVTCVPCAQAVAL